MEQTPFGLCGMPCGLCPMYHINGQSRCVGCKEHEDSFSSKCKMFRCAGQKGHQSCGLCEDYPCKMVQDMDEFKGFDTGKVWLLTNAQIAEQGIERWRAGYQEKCDLLKIALENHNDGRMKNYLCKLFVHSDLPLLKKIMQQAESMDEQSPRDRGKRFKQIVQSMAADTN